MKRVFGSDWKNSRARFRLTYTTNRVTQQNNVHYYGCHHNERTFFVHHYDVSSSPSLSPFNAIEDLPAFGFVGRRRVVN